MAENLEIWYMYLNIQEEKRWMEDDNIDQVSTLATPWLSTVLVLR
jgi:hypothetical protein